MVGFSQPSLFCGLTECGGMEVVGLDFDVEFGEGGADGPGVGTAEEALIMGVGDDGDDLGDVEVALLVGKDADVLVDPENPGLVVAGDEVV